MFNAKHPRVRLSFTHLWRHLQRPFVQQLTLLLLAALVATSLGCMLFVHVIQP